MLRLLTDNHVPPGVGVAARKKAPLDIVPLREWHGGVYLHEEDPKLIAIAWDERRSIVTYDLNTFPHHIKARLEMGWDHAGVIYVSARYRQNAIGAIARGLIKLWQAEKSSDWTNRIFFLD